MCLQIIYSIYIYKQDLALNNQQDLICHKTQPNNNQAHQLQFSITVTVMFHNMFSSPARFEYLSFF